MPNNVSENRIKEVRKIMKLSQVELSKRLHVDQTAISQWERGRTYPSMETAIALSKLAGVSVDYLLGRDVDPAIPLSTGGVWVPVLGQVQAGIPVEAVVDIVDYEEITMDMANQGEHFALKIKGDSMEPRINNGDVIIVRKQDDIDTGDIAVVMVNGEEATVKRIKKRPEGLMLIPNNPAFEPMFYNNEQIQELPVKIIGKVVELRAKF